MSSDHLVPSVLFAGVVSVGEGLEYMVVSRTTQAGSTRLVVDGVGEFSPEGETRQCYLAWGQDREQMLEAAKSLILSL